MFFRGDPGLGFPLGSETVVDCSHIAELGPRNPALLTSSLKWACQLGHDATFEITVRRMSSFTGLDRLDGIG